MRYNNVQMLKENMERLLSYRLYLKEIKQLETIDGEWFRKAQVSEHEMFGQLKAH